MTTPDHWNAAYAAKQVDQLSWFQHRPALSLALVSQSGIAKSDRIIDVGGGASTFVDGLIEAGYQDVSVLDLSTRALSAAKSRLGQHAANVQWIEGDILHDDPGGPYALWHDRAVFHFLIDSRDRERYRRALSRAIAPGGVVLMATFAPDGPERCSGLPVQRWSPDDLARELGPRFRLIDSRCEAHVTPSAKEQRFSYCLFREDSAAKRP